MVLLNAIRVDGSEGGNNSREPMAATISFNSSTGVPSI
jgi:hypothetical protein